MSVPGRMRWALLVEYDGSGFVGWQRQSIGLSVQEALETALGTLTNDPAVRVLGAGRTDTGVHAFGQVAAFTTGKSLSADNVVRGTNRYLPATVRLRAARRVALDFNPRGAAVGRHYGYRLASGGVAPALERTWTAWDAARLDVDRMAETMALFRGRHDFSAFRSSQCQARRTVLDLRRAEVRAIPRGPDSSFGSLILFDFECRSFLHSMVRMLVGAAVEAGRGRLEPASIGEFLRTGRRPDSAFSTAPGHGLCLVSVQYPPEWRLWGSRGNAPAENAEKGPV